MDYNVFNVKRRMIWDILYNPIWIWMCIVLLLIVGLYIYTKTSTLEGFYNLEGDTKIQTCHGVVKSLHANKMILEEYKKRNAVTSMEHIEELIENFTNSSNTLGCDEIHLSHPIPDVLIPNRDDLIKEAIIKVQNLIGNKIETSE
jgi:phosphosulfolactate synthase (CoM biosynthesis protein A)